MYIIQHKSRENSEDFELKTASCIIIKIIKPEQMTKWSSYVVVFKIMFL